MVTQEVILVNILATLAKQGSFLLFKCLRFFRLSFSRDFSRSILLLEISILRRFPEWVEVYHRFLSLLMLCNLMKFPLRLLLSSCSIRTDLFLLMRRFYWSQCFRLLLSEIYWSFLAVKWRICFHLWTEVGGIIL